MEEERAMTPEELEQCKLKGEEDFITKIWGPNATPETFQAAFREFEKKKNWDKIM